MSKRLIILGAGESGTGAAILAKHKGYDVFVSDMGVIADKYKTELNEHGINWEEGKHTEELILNADEVVKSPGIPDKAPLVKALRDKGVLIMSELELAYRYSNAKMICITGTNGKTTTTMLTYHILQKAGLNVGLAGNVGHSLARQVALKDHDHYVIEVSSFQLDGMYEFKADIAVLTNITPDHLDRYDYKVENYVDSKFRVTRNQTESDLFIYNIDDELTIEHIDKYTINATKAPISYKSEVTNGAYVKDKQINITLKLNNINQTFAMQLSDLSLIGMHNTYNSMAAAVIANSLFIRKEIIRESLSDFKNIEHRLEPVCTVGGVEFINDSKATNVNSSWYALESMEKPVVWIAGGVDKGNDYEILRPLVRERVKVIVCLGLDNRKIHEAFGKDVDVIVNTTSAAEAVHVAYKLANKGDAVLLSPACASFDLFNNYEDRGWQFKREVRNL